MFSLETVTFLRALADNNEKPWFEANKPRYITHVRDAARSFCDTLAPRLAAQHNTEVTSKLFRIHRDLRFSKDKTPYNTHVHLSFADAATGASWMVGLQTDSLVVGYGVFAFDKPGLAHWRDVVATDAGDRLSTLLGKAQTQGLRQSEPDLKRVPSPFPADHQNATLLRHKGIALWKDGLPQEAIFGAGGPERINAELDSLTPLRSWMVEAL